MCAGGWFLEKYANPPLPVEGEEGNARAWSESTNRKPQSTLSAAGKRDSIPHAISIKILDATEGGGKKRRGRSALCCSRRVLSGAHTYLHTSRGAG